MGSPGEASEREMEDTDALRFDVLLRDTIDVLVRYRHTGDIEFLEIARPKFETILKIKRAELAEREGDEGS